MGRTATGTQVIDRAVEILETIAATGREGTTARDLCEKTGLTQATLYRQLQALERHGLVETASRRYRIGRGMLFFAAAAFESDALHEAAAAPLRRIAQSTGSSAALLVAHDTQAMCVARADGTFTARMIYANVGATAPLGVGPGSLCLLADLPGEERERIIEANRASLLGRYYLDEMSLRDAIERTRRDGFARDPGDVFQDVFGLAVQVRGYAGKVIAAIGISAVRERMTAEREPRVLAIMQEAAEEIGRNANPVSAYVPARPV